MEYGSGLADLESKVSEAKVVFASDPSFAVYSALEQARRALFLHVTGATTTETNILKARLFESGDNNGRLLANLAAEPKYQTIIPLIQTNGHLVL